MSFEAIWMKEGGITIKVPLSQLKSEDVLDKIKNHLKKNSKYAYTIAGLMIEIYHYKGEELNAPFKDWPKGAPSLYTKIRLALKKLKEEGFVDSKKQGKKVLYWWSKK